MINSHLIQMRSTPTTPYPVGILYSLFEKIGSRGEQRECKLNNLVWIFLREEGKGFGGVLTTSNLSFFIPQNWKDLERQQSIKMLDQSNYQIYPYHINKITNNEKTNYFPLLYLILKKSNKVEDNHSPLLSSPLLSFSLLPSTLLSLQTSKHSINACIRLNYTFLSLLRVDKQK